MRRNTSTQSKDSSPSLSPEQTTAESDNHPQSSSLHQALKSNSVEVLGTTTTLLNHLHIKQSQSDERPNGFNPEKRRASKDDSVLIAEVCSQARRNSKEPIDQQPTSMPQQPSRKNSAVYDAMVLNSLFEKIHTDNVHKDIGLTIESRYEAPPALAVQIDITKKINIVNEATAKRMRVKQGHVHFAQLYKKDNKFYFWDHTLNGVSILDRSLQFVVTVDHATSRSLRMNETGHFYLAMNEDELDERIQQKKSLNGIKIDAVGVAGDVEFIGGKCRVVMLKSGAFQAEFFDPRVTLALSEFECFRGAHFLNFKDSTIYTDLQSKIKNKTACLQNDSILDHDLLIEIAQIKARRDAILNHGQIIPDPTCPAHEPMITALVDSIASFKKALNSDAVKKLTTFLQDYKKEASRRNAFTDEPLYAFAYKQLQALLRNSIKQVPETPTSSHKTSLSP